MVALDALLAQFAGVISGFDLGDGVDLQSLGFGSSSSAWMQATSGSAAGASGLDKAGLFNLTLLGQYAANFSADADGHDSPDDRFLEPRIGHRADDFGDGRSFVSSIRMKD